MKKQINSGLNKIYDWCGYLAALCLIVLALSVLTSIISRLLGIYVAGLAEIAGYLMAASNCLGLAYTLRRGGHIRINLFTSRLSKSKQRFAELWAFFATSAITCYLAYFMVRLTYWSYILEEVSEGSDRWMLYYPQAVTAFGCCVLALAAFHSFIETLMGPSVNEEQAAAPDSLKEATNE